MTTEIRDDNHVWCPRCADHVQMISPHRAAKLVGSSPKTIYRYIETGNVYVIKVAGKTYRICVSCLIQPVES